MPSKTAGTLFSFYPEDEELLAQLSNHLALKRVAVVRRALQDLAVKEGIRQQPRGKGWSAYEKESDGET